MRIDRYLALQERIIYFLLYSLIFSVLSVQANTTEILRKYQSVQDTAIPDGLASQDWATIQAQIRSDHYRYRPDQHGGFIASNPGQGWQLQFGVDGTTTLKPYRSSERPYHIAMKLNAVGYKTPQALDKPLQISRQSSILNYQWSKNLREWWINSEDQLEQWFLITHKPEGAVADLPLVIQLELDTELKPVQHDNALQFVTPAGNTITYNKLKVWDVTGQEIPAQMKLAGHHLSLLIQDTKAKYPLTIDPSFQQTAYLKASNAGSNNQFGRSIAISGKTLVIGAHQENSKATGVNGNQDQGRTGDSNNRALYSGAAYVFIRNESGWHQQAYLKASNTRGSASFGQSVAISGDTIVIGASEDSDATGVNGDQNNSNAASSGAAYVFTRDGTTWSQQAYLKASNTELVDYFADSVAIDGDTIVIGASGEDSSAVGVDGDQQNNNASDSGAAYVFKRNGSNWSQQAYLKASNTGIDDFFGARVAISGDTIVVTAPGEDSDAIGVNGNQDSNDAPQSGAVYVFVRENTLWNQHAYLKASNAEAQDRFGYSVAISGNTLVVSAWGEDSNSIGVNSDENNNLLTRAGAAYVFIRDGVIWQQQAYLKPADTGESAYFGRNSAISNDLIAVAGDGGTYLFYRNGTSWNQIDRLKMYTSSVSVSGETVAVGNSLDDSHAGATGPDQNQPNISNSGSASIYQLGEINPDPVTPGRITGFVWLDTNGDGLQDANEPTYTEPLTAGLYERPLPGELFADPVKIVSTDGNGQFTFENLLSGGPGYQLCTSTEYIDQGLSVTRRYAGIHSEKALIDNDFDFSSCAGVGIDLARSIDYVYGLGLVGSDDDNQPPQPTEPAQPAAGNRVSGLVWLDNNEDGLQSEGEPGFAYGNNGIGVTTIALYPDGSTDLIVSATLDELSSGRYNFSNVPNGSYYLCASNEFVDLGLSVTTQNAGNDSVDSDFDNDPCAYNIIVTESQGAVIDLGLVGGPLNFNPVDSPLNDRLDEITVTTARLSVNHQWQQTDQLNSSNHAAVFFSAPTNNGAQRGVARMRRIDDSVQFRFQEWSYLDGHHADETIHAASFPVGRWNSGNTQIEVGQASISGTRQWKTIQFDTTFSNPPAVSVSLQSANGSDAVDVHVRNITASSMQIALYEEEAKNFSGHISETVAYLLVSTDQAVVNLGNDASVQLSLPYQTAGVSVNHNWINIADNCQIRLEEDQSSDPEVFHTNERVQVLKINDFYLTLISSAVGGDSSVVRIRK